MRKENPYTTEYPVNPEQFAGRKKEIEAFKKALSDTIKSEPSSPVNIAVVGSFGIGKTSLLEKFEEIAISDKVFIITITLTPSRCRNIENFCYDTIDKIHKSAWESENLSAKIKEGISKWKINSLSVGFLTAEVKEMKLQPSSITQLATSLSDLWHKYLKDEVPAAVVMYDDIHYLAENCPDGLYDLRGIFQDLRKGGCRYMLIVSGAEDSFEKIRGISEPLMRFFEHIELRPFTLEETREALYLPLKNVSLRFDNRVIDEIQTIAHGHPYFIKFIAHDLFEHKNKGVIDIKLFNSTYPKIFEHLTASRFIKDYGIASENERRVLLAIAKHKDVVSLQKIKGVVSNVETCISRLEDKRLIIKHDRGMYSLYHPLFKEYLRQMK